MVFWDCLVRLRGDGVPEVVTLGESMVLFTPESDGPLRYVHRFTKRIGGAESNVCIGLVRLGHSAGWISRVGDDEFGRYLVASIRGEGVDTSQVRVDPDAPTGVYFRERRALGGGRVYYYRRGSAASRLQPDDLDGDYIRSARILVGSGITPALSPSCRATLERAIDIAQEAGIPFVFDPNLRMTLWPPHEAREVLRSLIARADIVLPGDEEAVFLTGEADPLIAGRMIQAMGPKQVVVKVGAAGAWVLTEDEEILVPGFDVGRVVDPVGAGDAFAAGYVAGLLEGLSPLESARLGNACGAFVVSVSGDIEGLPERADVEELLVGQAVPDVRR